MSVSLRSNSQRTPVRTFPKLGILRRSALRDALLALED